MRLWHKDLIQVLPRQQLLGQWRECCAIARNIAVNGTPNHILVNKILEYPMEDFHRYARLVADEMEKRGYRCDYKRFAKYKKALGFKATDMMQDTPIFDGWHNDRYLRQCYYNLQEKYDCGGISDEEYCPIADFFTFYRIGGTEYDKITAVKSEGCFRS